MKIKSLQVVNYKSFRESNSVRFSDGFNIVSGQNNSGKSAFVEALSTSGWENRPHKSTATPADHEGGQSSSTLNISVSYDEFVNKSRTAGKQIFIPSFKGIGIDDPLKTVNFLRNAKDIILTIRRVPGSYATVTGVSVDGHQSDNASIHLTVHDDDRVIYHGGESDFRSISPFISNIYDASCYSFRAERLAIGIQPIRAEKVLKPDASNLADVLNSFQIGNKKRFSDFLSDLKFVIPNIEQITTETFLQNASLPGQIIEAPLPHVRIRVWLVGSQEDRADLAFDMKDCGTGVGQVVSILYVIHSAASPKCIIIDEPNSFLHPGATRNLYEVFKRFPQHQFIVTTHSGQLLSSAENPSFYLVSWRNGESQITGLDVENTNDVRMILDDLGVRLSDVFGADQIVWVEGPTEAKTFPLVLNHCSVGSAPGLKFIPVTSTSEISRNTPKAKTIVGIYERISTANALIPPTVSFGLDRENFKEDQIKALEMRRGGKVKFLPRRCLENFALSFRGISLLLSSLEGADPDKIHENVLSWIGNNARLEKYSTPKDWDGDVDNKKWLERVDGARLLYDMFNDLTDSRYPYDKVAYTPKIIAYRLDNEIAKIGDLIEFVKHITGA